MPLPRSKCLGALALSKLNHTGLLYTTKKAPTLVEKTKQLRITIALAHIEYKDRTSVSSASP